MILHLTEHQGSDFLGIGVAVSGMDYNTLYILFQIQQYLYFQLIFLLIIMAVIVNIQILFCLNGTVSFFYITNLITPYKIKYLLFL